MRDLILKRLAEMKAATEDFSPRDWRWSGVTVGGANLRDVDFTQLPDDQLLPVFEGVVKQFHAHM